jgi:hypothetical protein
MGTPPGVRSYPWLRALESAGGSASPRPAAAEMLLEGRPSQQARAELGHAPSISPRDLTHDLETLPSAERERLPTPLVHHLDGRQKSGRDTWSRPPNLVSASSAVLLGLAAPPEA